MERRRVAFALPLIAAPQAKEPLDPFGKLLCFILGDRWLDRLKDSNGGWLGETTFRTAGDLNELLDMPRPLDEATLSRAVRDPYGERDTLVPLSDAWEFRRMIPDSRIVVLRGAGHNPMYHHPAIFNQAVLDFLET